MRHNGSKTKQYSSMHTYTQIHPLKHTKNSLFQYRSFPWRITWYICRTLRKYCRGLTDWQQLNIDLKQLFQSIEILFCFLFCKCQLSRPYNAYHTHGLLLQTEWRGRFVDVSVCVLVTTVNPTKTEEPIEMPFDGQSRNELQWTMCRMVCTVAMAPPGKYDWTIHAESSLRAKILQRVNKQ